MAQTTSFDGGYFEPVPLDCSISQILRTRHSKGFRQPFIDNPYLAQTTLRQVLKSPFAMGDFLQRCRELPHCGDTTINRLIAVIEIAASGSADQGPHLR